jgi:hypothetical protein
MKICRKEDTYTVLLGASRGRNQDYDTVVTKENTEYTSDYWDAGALDHR